MKEDTQKKRGENVRKQPDIKEQRTRCFIDDRRDVGIAAKCAGKSALITFIVIHVQRWLLPQTNSQTQFLQDILSLWLEFNVDLWLLRF